MAGMATFAAFAAFSTFTEIWGMSHFGPIIPLASSATNGYSRISERQVSGENRSFSLI